MRFNQSCLILLGALAWLLGCGAEFDSIGQVQQLRVLGVRKSASYAQPGESVQLDLLYHDGGSDQLRDIELMWLSGCKNPPADLFELCFERFGTALREVDTSSMAQREGLDSEASLDDVFRLGIEAGTPRVALGPDLALGFQRSFELEVDEDIIEERPPPPDPKLPPYGLNYVFFAACAGELHLLPQDDEFPIKCLDAAGDPLGAEDFVVGYAAVFAYEELRNENPAIVGIEVNGESLPEEQFCVGLDCDIIQPDSTRKCETDDPVVEACEEEEEDSEACPELGLRVLVDEDSVDVDGVLSRVRGERVEEQMWVNYHADRGSFSFDVALVNDVSTGFNDEPTTKFLAPERAGPTQIWAVVRDNRGGAEWARFQVCVR